MGPPFLEDGFHSPEERRAAISDEVEAYLAAKAGNPIPGKEDAGKEMPEALYWALMIDRWGLPHGGGWLDEPYHFMLDVEAAEIGRERHLQVQEANRRLRAQREQHAATTV